MSNIIVIEFFNKKNFPPGKWLQEPDLCYWEHNFPCLAVRDMHLGIWSGFVAVPESNLFFGKSIEDLMKIPEAIEIFLSVYGGISGVGRLPPKFKEYTKNHWWIGIETSHGGDLMPLLKLENSNDDMAKLLSNQSYKDLRFIRRETNKLANLLSKLK